MVLLEKRILIAINQGVKLNSISTGTLFLLFMLSSNCAIGGEIVFYEKPNANEISIMIIVVVIGLSIAIGATYSLGSIFSLFQPSFRKYS